MATNPFGRWPQLDTIFAAALDLAPGDRPAFLERSCAGDFELQQELEELLVAATASSDFLEDRERLLRPVAATSIAATSGPAHGERVGAYRLIGELGRGGMGLVYLAERADQAFEQRVAVKVLVGWLATPGEVRRFQRERRILARLQHPNIARLVDGGVLADGRPYYVMEHIDGVPIDCYCDERHLDIRARLELFLQVCAAVAFAHRNLVVHRDIKPRNVLVTADATVKLLDFGIARLLPEDASETTAITRTGRQPMTPEYASPEMRRGEPVGTGSDVYQLGILLYALLTGQTPVRAQGRGAPDTERALRTANTDRPSVAVARAAARGSAGSARDEVAEARATTPDRLRRRLRGDLDTIALVALRPEPERRYASVDQLADDVRRHLQGRPVRARSDTALYRTSRFVARHKFGVATGALIALLLIAFAFIMARQARHTASERDKAEQVTRFVVDLIGGSAPGAALGDTLTARRVLQLGEERVRAELSQQPEVRARLLAVIGNLYRKRGLYRESRPLLEEAIRIQRRVLRPNHRDLGASLSQLGLLFMDQRQAAAAEPLFREALAIARSGPASADSVVAVQLNEYAYALHVQGKFAPAESAYRAALAIHRRNRKKSPDYTVTLSNLGWILMNRGDYAASDSALGAALAIRRTLHRGGHPTIANSLAAVAYLRNQEERFGEAEPLAREALDIRRALYGDSHWSVADALATLAASEAGQRHFAEAETLYRRSFAIFARTTGEDTRDAALVMARLSSVLAANGRLAEAEETARRALAIYTARLGTSHPSTIAAATALANILVRVGRTDEADALYRDGLPALQATWPGDHPQTARLLAALGHLELARGDTAAALEPLQQALGMFERTLPHGRVTRARTQAALGQTLLGLGRPADAEPILRAAHAALASELGAQDPEAGAVAAALLRRSQSQPSSSLSPSAALGPDPPGSPAGRGWRKP